MFAIAVLVALVWLFGMLFGVGNRVGQQAQARVEEAETPAGRVAAGVNGSCSLTLVALAAVVGALALLSILAPSL